MYKRFRSDSGASYAKCELKATPQNIYSRAETRDQFILVVSTHSAIFYSRMPRKIVTTNVDMFHSPSSALQPFLGLFSSTDKKPR